MRDEGGGEVQAADAVGTERRAVAGGPGEDPQLPGADAQAARLGVLSRDNNDDGGTVRTVAQKLGCSTKDVVEASELCREAEGQGPDSAAREVYEEVLAGRTPIRRWKAAVAGLAATRDRPRRPVDYAALAARAIRSLETVFRAWPELRGELRDGIGEALRQCLDAAPEEAREWARCQKAER